MARRNAVSPELQFANLDKRSLSPRGHVREREPAKRAVPRQPIKRRDSSRFYVVKDNDFDAYAESTAYSTLRSIRDSLNEIVLASRSVAEEQRHLLSSGGSSNASSATSGDSELCSIRIENECARVSQSAL